MLLQIAVSMDLICRDIQRNAVGGSGDTQIYGVEFLEDDTVFFVEIVCIEGPVSQTERALTFVFKNAVCPLICLVKYFRPFC